MKDLYEPYVAKSDEVKKFWPKIVINYYIDNVKINGTVPSGNGTGDPEICKFTIVYNCLE